MDRFEHRFLDGIRFGFETADLSFKRLHENFLDATQREKLKQGLPPAIYSSAITDAWAAVDSMHRLKGLLERTPGLKLKEPEVALYLINGAVEELGDLRNSFRHAREDFYELPSTETAIWGVINWCVPVDEHHFVMLGIVPGTITEGEVTGD